MESRNISLAVPVLSPGLKYHCFIAFSYKDEVIARRIDKFLEGKLFKCCICDKESVLGDVLNENIYKFIESSRRALIILSENYMKSKWYDYEIRLCLEKSQRTISNFMIPIAVGLGDSDIPGPLTPYLHLKYSGNEEDLYKIARAVAGEDDKRGITLPVGNVAEGLAWSYYYGYLKLVLPGMKDKCEKYMRDKGISQDFMAPKLIILIPNSGFCPPDLASGESGSKIVCDGNMDPILKSRAGNRNRPYVNTVYKYTDDDGQDYYAPSEFATPVLSMFEMEQERIANLDNDHKLRQVATFHKTLDTILSQTSCCSTYSIVQYNDNEGSECFRQEVIRQIKQSIEQEKRKNVEQTETRNSLSIGLSSLSVNP